MNQKNNAKTVFLSMTLITVLSLLLLSSCTPSQKDYEQKQYPFGSTGNQVEVQPQPSQNSTIIASRTNQTANQTRQTQNITVARPLNTSSTTTPSSGTVTGTITKDSKTISTEHLDILNTNLITVTGTKNVELSVGSVDYLFKNPRIDTDGTLCFISVNGIDHIVSKDSTYPLNGISIELRTAIAARNVENSLCEFLITK